MRCLCEADLALCRWSRGLPHQRTVDTALAVWSRVTDDGVGWVAAGIVAMALDRDRRRPWLSATATVWAADRVSVTVKRLVGQPRPDLRSLPPLASTASPLSLPSSHTAVALAAARAFGALVPSWPLWLVALATAASRPYLGVHYPSDVLAGAAIGHVVGSCGRRVIGSPGGY